MPTITIILLASSIPALILLGFWMVKIYFPKKPLIPEIIRDQALRAKIQILAQPIPILASKGQFLGGDFEMGLFLEGLSMTMNTQGFDPIIFFEERLGEDELYKIAYLTHYGGDIEVAQDLKEMLLSYKRYYHLDLE